MWGQTPKETGCGGPVEPEAWAGGNLGLRGRIAVLMSPVHSGEKQ